MQKHKTFFMAFNMIFTIYNCTTYFKSQLTVKSISNMQENGKFSLFKVTKLRPPPPLKQPFLPSKKTLYKYSNIYLFGITKYRKERSFRERKISHERKVLFQLFGSNYIFLLIQNTIFDMIIIYSMLLYV